MKAVIFATTWLLAASLAAEERAIPQGANISPDGHRLEVTSKSLRLDGRAIVPVMGEVHYSRLPREEWPSVLAAMKEGGISIVSTYVFWNHHEWNRGEYDFTGNRDLGAFLAEVEKLGLWCVLRIGPWAHGECREGGLPDWLLDEFEGPGMRKKLRSCNELFLEETGKFYRRVAREAVPHLWKNGGCVVGVQLENESPGPWPYYQALKRLAVEAGFDTPLYTRTGWPRLNGPETTFGEMIPLYGDYAEGFWDRKLSPMPGSYSNAFLMRPVRTSAAIATEQLGKQIAQDAAGAGRYPYFTCELGGGMASSYHRRLRIDPMDVFSIAVAKLGSGSNLPGFYMYCGGSNPADCGVNMAESQRGRFTKHNDLPILSYEFQAPLSEFGEKQGAYWMIQALAEFCREYGEEFAGEAPVFISENETRRGRFVFHNDYIRHFNPSGNAWIGVAGPDGKVQIILDGRELAKIAPERDNIVRYSVDSFECVKNASGQRGTGNGERPITSLVCVKKAGVPRRVETGPAGVAAMPGEEAWSAAAEYIVPFQGGDEADEILEIFYEGDMARLYADGRLVQDDFYKGLPLRYALRRLPKGTKTLVLKVLPLADNAKELVYFQQPPFPPR